MVGRVGSRECSASANDSFEPNEPLMNLPESTQSCIGGRQVWLRVTSNNESGAASFAEAAGSGNSTSQQSILVCMPCPGLQISADVQNNEQACDEHSHLWFLVNIHYPRIVPLTVVYGLHFSSYHIRTAPSCVRIATNGHTKALNGLELLNHEDVVRS